jgi:hypothetical protein
MSQEDTQEGQEPTPATATDEGEKPGKTFDEGYVKQLRAEAAQHRREAQEARAKVQEYESANQSEVEKLTSKLAKAEERANTAEGRLTRFQVATEKQLPAELVDRLQGSTPEELAADADKLLELVKKPEVTPEFDGGTREPAPEAQKPEDAHDNLALSILGLTPNQ